MAGSSLFFDIFGRDKGVGKVFDDVAGKATGLKGVFGTVGKIAAGAFAVGGLIALGSTLGDFIGGTLQDLQRIETINAQTSATIKSTGGAAGVSASEIADLASSIENLTATEGELVQEGANTLLTFTNIKNAAGEGNDIFNQATLAVTDYSRAMGTDMQAASIQVGKALNDPIKGVSALSKAGVQFTDQQKEMITAMVEAGDVAGAQKIILGELNTQFGGSGAAYAETTAGKIALLGHAWGNFGETLLGAVAPALGQFAEIGTNAINWVTESPGMAAFSGWLGGLPGLVGAAASGLAGIFDILANGDFTGPLFGTFDEDSGLVDFLFRVREGFQNLGALAGPIIASIAPAFAQLGPAIGGVLPMLSPLGLVFQALLPVLPQIGAMVAVLAVQLSGMLGAALAQVAPLFGMLVSTMSGVFIQVIPLVVQLVTMLSAALGQVVPVVSGVLAALMPLIATLITQLAPIFTQLVTAVLPPVIQILGMVAAAIGPLIQVIAGLLIPIIQALLPVVVTVFSVIAQVITSAMQIVQGIIQVVTGIITGNWRAVWAGIQNILSGVWNAIVTLVRGALSIVGSVISGGLNAAAGVVGSILGSIAGTFSSIFGGIGRAVGDTIGTVVGFFTSLPGKIMGALSGAGSWLYNVGADIVRGLQNGVASLAGSIGNFFLSLLPGWIVGPFKAALGISSPSKVFAGYGENIGEGIIQGVSGMKEAVNAAVGSLVSVPAVGAVGAAVAVAATNAVTAVPVGRRGAAAERPGESYTFTGPLFGSAEQIVDEIQKRKRRANVLAGTRRIMVEV